MPIPYCICAEIAEESKIWKKQSGYRKNTEESVPTKRSRNSGGRGLQRPYPYVGVHIAGLTDGFDLLQKCSVTDTQCVL